MSLLPSFPRAQQAQISPSLVYTSLALLIYFLVRANQRDIYHISSLKEETENVFRNFLGPFLPVSWSHLNCIAGTRWLARWDKELDILIKLLYYCLTTGRGEYALFSIHSLISSLLLATQTLGEEYTDIWQYSSTHQRFPPHGRVRLALILLLTLPQYLVTRWSHVLPSSPWIPISTLRGALSVASELNLAIFYVGGVYYDVVKRALGIQYVRLLSSVLSFG